MGTYDLTHPLHAGMPVYPGKPQPVIRQAASLQKDGYRELGVEMEGHTGTHIDAPSHMLQNGKTLDQYPVSQFAGKAQIIPVPQGKKMIGLPFLKGLSGAPEEPEFLLFRTGWSRHWGKDEYLRGFPVLTVKAARWLAQRPLKGIGIDTLSVDPLESETWPVHHILFDADLVIVENLYFPEDLADEAGLFYCFPLNLREADGAPVRAVFQPSRKPKKTT